MVVVFIGPEADTFDSGVVGDARLLPNQSCRSSDTSKAVGEVNADDGIKSDV